MRRTCRYSKLWWEEQQGRCRWHWTAASASGGGVPLRCSAPPGHPRHHHYHHHHTQCHPHHHLWYGTDRDGDSWPNWSVERSLHKRQQPGEDVRMNPHLYNSYKKVQKVQNQVKGNLPKESTPNFVYIFSLAVARFCFVGLQRTKQAKFMFRFWYSDIWNCLCSWNCPELSAFFKTNQVDGTSSRQGVVLFSHLWYLGTFLSLEKRYFTSQQSLDTNNCTYTFKLSWQTEKNQPREDVRMNPHLV